MLGLTKSNTIKEFRARIQVTREHVIFAEDLGEAERRFKAIAQTNGGRVLDIWDPERYTQTTDKLVGTNLAKWPPDPGAPA